jgi:hypothetical protein
MNFKITHYSDEGAPEIGISPAAWYSWTLAKDDEVIAQSPKLYDTESDARSAIMKSKIAMRGARFASVVVEEAPEPDESA